MTLGPLILNLEVNGESPTLPGLDVVDCYNLFKMQMARFSLGTQLDSRLARRRNRIPPGASTRREVESLSPLAGLFAERPVTTNPFPTEHAPLSLKREITRSGRSLCIEAGRPEKAVERTGFRGVPRCAVGPSVKDVRPGRRRP